LAVWKPGPAHLEADLADAGDGRGQERNLLGDPLAQDQGDHLLEGHGDAVGGVGLDRIGPGLALDIVQLQRGHRLVAGGQEARQVEVGHHRLAHGHGLGARADGGVGPGHGHDPQLAVEVGGRQLDHRLAVQAGLDDAGPQGHGLDRRHRQALAAQLVGAEIDIGRRAHVRVEQAAVVVAIVQGQGPLAEVPLGRVGAVLAGQAQDALVHRRDGDLGLLAEAQALDLDRHLDRGLGVQLHRRADVDRQLAALGVERHVDQAQGPLGLGRADRVARLDHRDHHIGPAAPGGRGLQAHGRAVLADAEGLEVDQPVGGHGHLGLAGIGRLQGDLDRVALGIGLGPGADPHEVGRLAFLGRRAPARRELGHGLGAVRPLDHQAVVAPAQAAIEARGRAGADIDRGLGHHRVAAGAPPLPAAVLLEPVVVPVLADQGVGRRRRDPGAGGVDRDHLQADRRIAAPGVALLDLDAVIDRLAAHLQLQALAHRTTAGLEHRGGHRRHQRLGGVAGFGGAEVQHGVAVAVGDGRAQLDELLVEGRQVVAPFIALVLRERVAVGAQPRLALGLQARARRAVEEAGRDVDLALLAGRDRHGLLARGGDRQPLRGEVLDAEAERAGVGVAALHLQHRRPAAARRAAGQGDVGQHGAGVGAAEGVALELHARGPLDQDVALAVVDRLGQPVADHGRQVHGLAGAIDAAVGIEIAVDVGGKRPAAVGLGAAADALLGQVDRRAVQVQHRQVALVAIGHDHLGPRGAVALEQGVGEARAAVGVALGQARSSPSLATRATRTPDRVLAVFSERTTTSRDSAPS
jgi:hypothetical protein